MRAALTAEDADAFDGQWSDLMRRATERLDLSEVLEAWRPVAWATAAHGSEDCRRVVASAADRARSGERGAGAVPWNQLKAELGLPE